MDFLETGLNIASFYKQVRTILIMEKDDFLKRLETEIKILKLSHYTLRNYLDFNKQLLEHSKKKPEEIEKQDIKNFLADKMSAKSPSSNIVFMAAIKFAFSNLLGKDPTAGIKRPKKENKIPIVLSKEEITNLINSAGNQKSKFILQLLYSSGLRVSEIVSLKSSDIDLNENIGWVRKGKGRKDRMFILSQKLSKKIKKFLEKNSGWEYLFSKKNPLTTRNIQKIVQKAARKAGINKRVHPHTLRHSFATHLLDSGVDIRKIQELLGHSNISTTMIYAHVSATELKKIKSPLDNL